MPHDTPSYRQPARYQSIVRRNGIDTGIASEHLIRAWHSGIAFGHGIRAWHEKKPRTFLWCAARIIMLKSFRPFLLHGHSEWVGSARGLNRTPESFRPFYTLRQISSARDA